jgi:hypothetical protein
MSIRNNKLYYLATILQFVLLLFFYFTRECVNCEHDNYINTIRDYRLCADKMDSIITVNKGNTLTCKDSSESSIKSEPNILHGKNIHFVDTVKVSYPGKDGVLIVTKYPFHKVIVD